MTAEQIRDFLGWCSVINIGILLIWWLFYKLAHDFIYRIHSQWFRLSVEKFDSIHYAAMAFFKLTVFVFNIVPYIALSMVL